MLTCNRVDYVVIISLQCNIKNPPSWQYKTPFLRWLCGFLHKVAYEFIVFLIVFLVDFVHVCSSIDCFWKFPSYLHVCFFLLVFCVQIHESFVRKFSKLLNPLEFLLLLLLLQAPVFYCFKGLCVVLYSILCEAHKYRQWTGSRI